MGYLSKAGRILYGVAIAVMGYLTIYYNDFPYFLLPPRHPREPWFVVISGITLILAGVCLVFLAKRAKQVSLLFGVLLLAVFCFYYIPYELFLSHNYASLGEWENAEKELALAGGALAIAGCSPAPNKNLMRLGAVLFAITIVCFGTLHFVFGNEASGLVPSWIPAHLFWIYFAGVALLGSGIAIILKIKIKLAATLLGIMVLTWFIILHMPRVMVATAADMAGEIASAFLALAYSGIAFVIAGSND